MGRSLSTWSPPWLWLSPALPSTVFNGSFLAKRSHTAEVSLDELPSSNNPNRLTRSPKNPFLLGHAHAQQSQGHPLSRRHPGHSTTKACNPRPPRVKDILFHDVIPTKKGQEQPRRFRSRTRRLPTLHHEATRKNKGAFPALHEGAYPNPVFDLTNVWRPVLPFRQVLAQIRPVPSSTLFPHLG